MVVWYHHLRKHPYGISEWWVLMKRRKKQQSTFENARPSLLRNLCRKHMDTGVSKNKDTPKWMVYIGKPY